MIKLDDLVKLVNLSAIPTGSIDMSKKFTKPNSKESGNQATQEKKYTLQGASTKFIYKQWQSCII